MQAEKYVRERNGEWNLKSWTEKPTFESKPGKFYSISLFATFQRIILLPHISSSFSLFRFNPFATHLVILSPNYILSPLCFPFLFPNFNLPDAWFRGLHFFPLLFSLLYTINSKVRERSRKLLQMAKVCKWEE